MSLIIERIVKINGAALFAFFISLFIKKKNTTVDNIQVECYIEIKSM